MKTKRPKLVRFESAYTPATGLSAAACLLNGRAHAFCGPAFYDNGFLGSPQITDRSTWSCTGMERKRSTNHAPCARGADVLSVAGGGLRRRAARSGAGKRDAPGQQGLIVVGRLGARQCDKQGSQVLIAIDAVDLAG